MSGNRVYVPFMVFNARIVNMQHLWEPSREYLGKPQDKPSWFVTCVTIKTRANWWEEPALSGAWPAYEQLLTRSGMTPQHITEWPVKDGDMPPEPGKNPAEWAKGHWVFGGSSNQPIKAEISQGNNVVPLLNRVGVKPGDYVALGLSAAIKQNNPRAIKHFCNTVLFMSAGEEIAVGNSVSGAELMAQARAQGLNPVGFAPAGGGYPGAQQSFVPPNGPGGPQPGFQQPGGFPGSGQPQGFAPTTAGPAFGVASGHGGMPGGAPGNATYPSSPGPGAFPGQR